MLVNVADDDSPAFVQSARKLLLNWTHCPAANWPWIVPKLMTFTVPVCVGAVAGLLPHQ